jgi:hypothetical protein
VIATNYLDRLKAGCSASAIAVPVTCRRRARFLLSVPAMVSILDSFRRVSTKTDQAHLIHLKARARMEALWEEPLARWLS